MLFPALLTLSALTTLAHAAFPFPKSPTGAVTTGFARIHRQVVSSLAAAAAPAAPAPAPVSSALAAPVGSGTALAAASKNGTAVAGAVQSVSVSGEAMGPDMTVLQLAFVLEDLESQFYAKALEKFSIEVMVSAGLSELQASIVIEQITAIQADESNHMKAVKGAIVALGGAPFSGCSFDFQAALADPVTFLGTARKLEAVGQAAYLGAANLLTVPELLTAAGSILTLEARHQSLLNVFNGGAYNPQSFDIALQPPAVLGLAGGFLKGCQASDFGLTANNPLTVSAAESKSSHFQTGTKLAFESIVEIDVSVLSCQMIVGGAPTALVFPANACYVPKNIDGPVAVYLTNTSTPLATDIIIQNVVQIVAGPDLIFVDTEITVLSSLFQIQGRGGGGGGRKGKGGKGNEVDVSVRVDASGRMHGKKEGGGGWREKRAADGGEDLPSSSRLDRKTRHLLPRPALAPRAPAHSVNKRGERTRRVVRASWEGME
ncbi:hypothetical protein JCM8097_008517 [Rhodosporidiobolus ruineniae]